MEQELPKATNVIIGFLHFLFARIFAQKVIKRKRDTTTRSNKAFF